MGVISKLAAAVTRSILAVLLASIPAALSAQSSDNPAAIQADPNVAAELTQLPLISTDVFTAPGKMVRPKLSPDGRQMVYREQVDGEKFLTVKGVDQGSAVQIATPKQVRVNWYRWAGNQRILLSLTSKFRLLDNGLRITSLHVFDLSTREFTRLGRRKQPPDGDNVLYVDPDGEYLLLSLQRTLFDYPAVFRIGIADNSIRQTIRSQSSIWRWIADEQGVVRMGISYKHNGINIYYRRSPSGKFKLISKIREKDSDEEREESLLDIAQIVSGSDEGYVLSNKKTGRFALHKFNYQTRKLGEVVLDHPENDITSYQLNNEGTALLAAQYTDSRDRIVWFNDKMKSIQAKLEKAVPGQEVWIQSRSRDNKRMIIFTTSSTDPGSYYLFEPDTKRLHRFGGINDPIDPAKMAETSYIKYTARDGLKIPAYLTLPKGREAKGLPLVIMPHGGPYGVRDTLDYDAQVQFLANRGYAVLRPNYRGSDSYGEDFYERGEGQIGRTMQDDLDDGMDWLVKEGIVDAGRVCLVGSSYGGYAALWGVIRNPERYRCAASFAGVTHWRKQLKYDGKFFKSRHARAWKKKVRGEEDFDLDSVSPAEQAARLKRPVLLTHGDEDGNVPISQFNMMLKAAKKAGANIESKVYKGEGHGLAKRANEKDWYDRLEAFLKKHNPP
ncbi:MAG: prolyl oligopeptidase family serine peptidase [Sphingorhabdus sp.]